MNNAEKIALLEGLLFLVGDEGIMLDEICEVLELEPNEVTLLLTELEKEYQQNTRRGFIITKFAKKYRLTTKKEYYSFYLKLANNKFESKLSQAALETLAIIAYRGPISKPEIEDLRGVNSDNVIHKLKARELIKEVGKSEIAGKPMNYQVTEEFLKVFKLSSLSELPELQETKLEDDEELFK
ncbi:SMC-Scp complex subunit ScpB [Spiroplasma chrysopicola]|uniref:Segregation and condensation protein B n=1 Tax=Spiroplasma chrysopicola DF-1 TaxID=1276227 RepID=R4U0X3_9MOLU|nr:SMC-Scp complex subunit ScpB [Spiroplasma chrysopicola]AGM24952.1 chromosome condensation and segregation factor B [Spiroplasma chrysopicola DF-1]